MKKTIIFNKGGLDAIATARNIIMELYSTLNKMAARLVSVWPAFAAPPELIGNVFKNGALMLSPLLAAVEGSWLYLCALRAILRLKSKRGIDTIAAPRGFPKT